MHTAHRITADSAVGEEFQVNSYVTGSAAIPAVASDGDRRFVATWDNIGSAGTDNDVGSIQGRRLDAPLFQDGFESGDVSAWSSSVP